MKLKLNKNRLKNLSKDNQALPAEMTPQVAGGTIGNTIPLTQASYCLTDAYKGCPTGDGCFSSPWKQCPL